MKKLLLLISLLLAQAVYAQDIPVCVDEDANPEAEMTFPCRLEGRDKYMMIVDMLLENKAAVRLIQRTGENGLMLDLFTEEDSDLAQVILMETNSGGENYSGVIQYKLRLSDCRGTDACGATYELTVKQETTGDGYTYSSKFSNQLTKVE